jgi:hypothetical protein
MFSKIASNGLPDGLEKVCKTSRPLELISKNALMQIIAKPI